MIQELALEFLLRSARTKIFLPRTSLRPTVILHPTLLLLVRANLCTLVLNRCFIVNNPSKLIFANVSSGSASDIFLLQRILILHKLVNVALS